MSSIRNTHKWTRNVRMAYQAKKGQLRELIIIEGHTVMTIVNYTTQMRVSDDGEYKMK